MSRLSPARLSMVTNVAAKPANSNSGSTPPSNCIRLRIGSPVRSNSSRFASRDASLLRTISRSHRSLARRNSRVRRSFSSAIAPAA